MAVLSKLGNQSQLICGWSTTKHDCFHANQYQNLGNSATCIISHHPLQTANYERTTIFVGEDINLSTNALKEKLIVPIGPDEPKSQPLLIYQIQFYNVYF